MIVKCLKSVLEGTISSEFKNSNFLFDEWILIGPRMRIFPHWESFPNENALFWIRTSQTIATIIDKDLPYVPWLTPYLYVLAGMGMTIAVQSSSIVLAILTPICGLGIVSLERAYPIVIGCDIGTTFTGLLAAFANPGSGKWVNIALHFIACFFSSSGAPCSVNEPFVNPKKGFRASMQVSMCHLFFNIFGACLWFVIQIMRKVPIGIAQFAARRTAKYRWWAVNYIIGFFFVFRFSLASSAAVTGKLLTGTDISRLW